MRAALLIIGVEATYVFQSALESLERWFLDPRYGENGMERPIWVEKSNDEQNALILYNSDINKGKKVGVDGLEDYFSPAVSDSRINSIFSAVMDETNKITMKEGQGTYYINEHSSEADLKAFAARVKYFASGAMVNPAAIAAMESAEDRSRVFLYVQKAAELAEKAAVDNALAEEEAKRKEAERINIGLEDENIDEPTYEVQPLDEDILNRKPITLENIPDIPDISEITLDDLDEEDLKYQPPLIQGSDEEKEMLQSSQEPSEAEINAIDITVGEIPVVEPETPKNGTTEPQNANLIEAINGLINKLGITEAEFISRLEKVLLIGKLAGGPQSQAVEEEKAPIAENSIPEEPLVADVADVPNETVGTTEEEEENLFGEVPEDKPEEPYNVSENDNNDYEPNIYGIQEVSTAEENSNDDEEPVEPEPEVPVEEPKAINEDLPPDELIKELANESANDDELFNMIVARKHKFGMPVLIKASNIDMRTYILTGVENHVDPSVKSKRIELI